MREEVLMVTVVGYIIIAMMYAIMAIVTALGRCW
jgi:hypothetical protein